VSEGWKNVSYLPIKQTCSFDPRNRPDMRIITRNSTPLQVFFKVVPEDGNMAICFKCSFEYCGAFADS